MEMIVTYLTQDFTECNDRFYKEVPQGEIVKIYQKFMEEIEYIAKAGNFIMKITFKPQKEHCVRI